MPSRGKVFLVAAALLMTIAADCGHTPAGTRQKGATLSSDGQPQTLYAGCSGEVVTEVSVLVVEGGLGGGDDSTLWRIERGSSVTDVSSFTIGEAPPGWITAQPLESAVPNETVVQFINNFGNSSEFVLTLDRLERGMVWNGASNIPPAEYLEEAQAACEDIGLGS